MTQQSQPQQSQDRPPSERFKDSPKWVLSPLLVEHLRKSPAKTIRAHFKPQGVPDEHD